MKITEQDGIGRLEKYDGLSGNVVLPEEWEGIPITVIGTKAFLSRHDIERLTLPGVIECIEDWAFAHMKNLKEIVLPAKSISFGKKVFLGCRSLERILFNQGEEIYQGIAYFLASMVVYMEERSIDFALAGDLQGQWEWLKEYDKALLQFVERDDLYGFEPAFIGWFNIEDVDDQQQAFALKSQKCKIALGLQRLLYGERLEEATKSKITEYLLGKWRLVAEMLTEDPLYSGDVRWFKLWKEIGGFRLIAVKELLERLTDKDPEVRAYLIECQGTESAGKDIFAELTL